MTDERPFTIRETLAAMVLEHDAGGITMATLREARQHLDRRDDWRSIATAPKEIEFRCLLAHRFSVVTGYWDGLAWVNERSRRGSAFAPTHWMPLPPTPEPPVEA